MLTAGLKVNAPDSCLPWVPLCLVNSSWKLTANHSTTASGMELPNNVICKRGEKLCDFNDSPALTLFYVN